MSPAVSKEERSAACMALSAKRGKIAVSKLHASAKSMYEGMTIQQLSEFCLPPVKKP